MRHQRAVAAIALAAFASFILSVSLWFSGDREAGVFVGLWVPSILALGAFVLSALPGAAAGAAPRSGAPTARRLTSVDAAARRTAER